MMSLDKSVNLVVGVLAGVIVVGLVLVPVTGIILDFMQNDIETTGGLDITLLASLIVTAITITVVIGLIIAPLYGLSKGGDNE